MANDRKNMNQDQKTKNPQPQPQADRDPQGGRDPQRDRGQQAQQSGAQGGQGNRDQVRQARQAYPNKGSSNNSEHEGSPQQVGHGKLIEDDDEVERGNDLDDVSGEITERNPRQGKTDNDKDRH